MSTKTTERYKQGSIAITKFKKFHQIQQMHRKETKTSYNFFIKDIVQ